MSFVGMIRKWWYKEWYRLWNTEYSKFIQEKILDKFNHISFGFFSRNKHHSITLIFILPRIFNPFTYKDEVKTYKFYTSIDFFIFITFSRTLRFSHFAFGFYAFWGTFFWCQTKKNCYCLSQSSLYGYK